MIFTVITSCYNSVNTLRRTYESLVAQSCREFEWILVDDFSSDNGATRQLIIELAAEAPFLVKYKFLEKNYFSAKSTATACSLASGKYACILDHDDQLLPDTLERVRLYLDKYEKQAGIAGICGRCVNENGDLIGPKFKVDEQIASEGEIRFKQRVTSELFQFTKIDIMRPWFEKMKPGYTNGFVWAKISRHYNYLFVNDVFRIYDTQLPTSYSNLKTEPIRFPREKAEALLETLDAYADFLIFNPIFSAKMSASLIRHCLNAKMGLLYPKHSRLIVRMFLFISIPFGFLKSVGRI